jgi:hypothetical protein
LSVGVELVRELHGFGEHLVLCLFADPVKCRFVMVNQQHVFHPVPPHAAGATLRA